MSDEPQGTRTRPAEAPCLNCGNTATGRFCSECGQRKTWVRVSVRAMVADVLEDQLVLNRALPRTLGGLLFRPGWLTQEYVRGRIVSYIAPFRLYLVASVTFFLVLSFIGLAALDNVNINTSGLSPNADSTRAALLQRRAALQETDTTAVPATARAVMRQSLASIDAALAAIPDTATLLDPIRLKELERIAETGAGVDARGRQPWAQNITMEGPPGWMRRGFQRKVDEVAHLPPREALRAIIRDLLEYAPHMVFVLLPVFALLLKLLYVRQNRFYAEHFVFALHVHAFVFLIMTLIVLSGWGDLLLVLWIMLYVWLAMKRVYRQGWIRTTLKWWALGFTYSFVLLFGLLGLALVALALA